jgi:YD repeat-containing protein
LVEFNYASLKVVGSKNRNDGKLLKRTWARGVETTYSHNPATGDLLAVNYNTDDTTNLPMTYNRLGQQVSITDAAGQRTFGYNSHFQQVSETITDNVRKIAHI